MNIKLSNNCHNCHHGLDNSYARDKFAETVRVLDVSAPLVLGTAQAKFMAAELLARSLEESAGVNFNTPPNMLCFEAGDTVKISGQEDVWQITNLDGLGARSATMRRIGQGVSIHHSGAEPNTAADPIWVSSPDGFALDIADFSGNGSRSGPLVGVVISPFVSTLVEAPNGQETTLDRQTVIGALLTDLSPGPIGRFGYGANVDIYLPGVKLSALSDEELFGGGNLFAVETLAGWEILQARNVELISPNTYRLGTFLRGQFGTETDVIISAGARMVYLGAGWSNMPVNTALRGSDIDFSFTANGRSDSQNVVLNYQAQHLRPLSPVHLKAKKNGNDLHINWIRRTRIGGDDWASIDVPIGEESESYEVDIFDGETLILTKKTNTPNTQIPLTDLPSGEISVKVYQISQTYGRGRSGKLKCKLTV